MFRILVISCMTMMSQSTGEPVNRLWSNSISMALTHLKNYQENQPQIFTNYTNIDNLNFQTKLVKFVFIRG